MCVAAGTASALGRRQPQRVGRCIPQQQAIHLSRHGQCSAGRCQIGSAAVANAGGRLSQRPCRRGRQKGRQLAQAFILLLWSTGSSTRRAAGAAGAGLCVGSPRAAGAQPRGRQRRRQRSTLAAAGCQAGQAAMAGVRRVEGLHWHGEALEGRGGAGAVLQARGPVQQAQSLVGQPARHHLWPAVDAHRAWDAAAVNQRRGGADLREWDESQAGRAGRQGGWVGNEAWPSGAARRPARLAGWRCSPVCVQRRASRTCSRR